MHFPIEVESSKSLNCSWDWLDEDIYYREWLFALIENKSPRTVRNSLIRVSNEMLPF